MTLDPKERIFGEIPRRREAYRHPEAPGDYVEHAHNETAIDGDLRSSQP